MKQQVSHRLDSELLAWATEYGGSRGSSRAVVIEEALRHFRALSRGGVPDLPADGPVMREAAKVQAATRMSNPLATRQARVNAMIDRARKVRDA